MGFFTKAVFFIGLLYVLYASYGVDFLSNSANRSRMPNTEEKNVTNVAHSLEIPMQRDGHYWLDMQVSNYDVQFIVDTGATLVTLSYSDAQKMNLYLNESDFSIPVNTAGGVTKMAEINIDRISYGVIDVYNVQALVAQEGMLSVSLLGMNFLNRLDQFQFDDGKLTIEQ